MNWRMMAVSCPKGVLDVCDAAGSVRRPNVRRLTARLMQMNWRSGDERQEKGPHLSDLSFCVPIAKKGPNDIRKRWRWK